MAKKYRVTPTAQEREDSEAIISTSKADARVSLQADGAPGRVDQEIASALNLGTRAIDRVRRRFAEEGLESALLPGPAKRVHASALDGSREAHLIALARSAAPDGKKRWTPRLLADRVVELGYAAKVSHEATRCAGLCRR